MTEKETCEKSWTALFARFLFRSEKVPLPKVRIENLEWNEKKARFDGICAAAMRETHAMGNGGIGTLCEKRMHAVIKRYLCEDENYHEVKIGHTRFVADVCMGNEIYEVQTGALFPMKKKIAYYMEQTDYTVTVVHPMSALRWMCWIDPDTKEISPRKRVARYERREQFLAELYAFLPYLGSDRLRFRLLQLETQDFKILGNRTSKDPKKQSQKYERVPIALLEEERFDEPSDFASFLPKDLPTHGFTVKEFSHAVKLRGRDAYSAVRVLAAVGLLEQVDPIGRSMAWRRTDETDADCHPCPLNGDIE